MYTSEVASLQRIAMFRDVPIAKLKLIAMAGRRVHYRPAEVVLRQGEPALMVYVIMDGQADVLRERDGKPVKVSTVGPGSLMGELGVVLDKPYLGTIIASTAVTALQIDSVTFIELLSQVPQLSMALIRELARRLMASSDHQAKVVS